MWAGVSDPGDDFYPPRDPALFARFAAAAVARYGAGQVRVRMRVRSRRHDAATKGPRVRLRCSRTCDAGLVLLARHRRPGRATLQHVAGRWTRSLRAKRWRTTRLRLARAENAWLAGHPDATLTLSVTALTTSGAVDERETTIRRRRR